MRPPYKVGDRVIRNRDVCDGNSFMRHGEVIEVYSQSYSYGGNHGVDHELYAVRWDDAKHTPERGYFRHGLMPELVHA